MMNLMLDCCHDCYCCFYEFPEKNPAVCKYFQYRILFSVEEFWDEEENDDDDDDVDGDDDTAMMTTMMMMMMMMMMIPHSSW